MSKAEESRQKLAEMVKKSVESVWDAEMAEQRQEFETFKSAVVEKLGQQQIPLSKEDTKNLLDSSLTTQLINKISPVTKEDFTQILDSSLDVNVLKKLSTPLSKEETIVILKSSLENEVIQKLPPTLTEAQVAKVMTARLTEDVIQKLPPTLTEDEVGNILTTRLKEDVIDKLPQPLSEDDITTAAKTSFKSLLDDIPRPLSSEDTTKLFDGRLQDVVDTKIDALPKPLTKEEVINILDDRLQSQVVAKLPVQLTEAKVTTIVEEALKGLLLGKFGNFPIPLSREDTEKIVQDSLAQLQKPVSIDEIKQVMETSQKVIIQDVTTEISKLDSEIQMLEKTLDKIRSDARVTGKTLKHTSQWVESSSLSLASLGMDIERARYELAPTMRQAVVDSVDARMPVLLSTVKGTLDDIKEAQGSQSTLTKETVSKIVAKGLEAIGDVEVIKGISDNSKACNETVSTLPKIDDIRKALEDQKTTLSDALLQSLDQLLEKKLDERVPVALGAIASDITEIKTSQSSTSTLMNSLFRGLLQPVSIQTTTRLP